MLFSNNHKLPRINSGHHLAPDDCWIFNQKVINSIGFHGGKVVTPNGSFNVTPLGEALVHTSTAHKEGLGLDSDLLPTQNCTIVLRYRKSDTTNRSSAAFGIDDGAGTAINRCGAHVPFNDGKVYWDFGGAVEGTTRLSIASLSFSADTWVFTTGARGMEIWQNGIKRASNSANPTRTTSSSNFALGAGGAAVSDLAEYVFIYVYKHQLSESECLEITQNPYVFLSDNSFLYDKLLLFLPNYFPDSLSLNWSIITPTTTIGAINVTPTPLTVTWSVITPTVSNKNTITPSNLSVHFSIISPTLNTGNINLTPNALTANWSVVTPSVYTHSKLNPIPLNLIWSIRGNYDTCPAGPYPPAYIINDTSIGDYPWSNPDNVKISDNIYTSIALASQTSNRLNSTHFNFNISPNKIIKGITVDIEIATLSGTSTINARLIKNGNVSSTSKSFFFNNVEAIYTLGNSTDLWGETWTPEDINSNNFGISIRRESATTNTYFVDSIRITVYCADIPGFRFPIINRWIGGLAAFPPTKPLGFRTFFNKWVGGLSKSNIIIHYNVTPDSLNATWSIITPVIVGGAGKGFRTALGRRFAWISLGSGSSNPTPTPLNVNWSVVAPTVVNKVILTPTPLLATWSVITPSNISNIVRNAIPNPLIANWSVITPNVVFTVKNVTPTALIANWSIIAPVILNDSSTVATYPTNLIVLDKSIINVNMTEKSLSQQVMYSLNIEANKLKQSSKLRVTATLARNKGVLKNNRLKCSYTNPQAILGIDRPDEPFYTGPFYNSSINFFNPDSVITDFLTTSSIDGTATSGACFVRICCPPFRTRADQTVYADTGVFQGSNPNGVFSKGDEYGPACAYQDSFIRFENVLEGSPKTALLGYIKPGSTVQNMTAYGVVYDSGNHKMSIRMWKNQSLLVDEGHIFHETDYTLQPGEYLSFICDASYKDFFYPPQPTWYPYVDLEWFTSLGGGVTLLWELNGAPPVPFNTAWDNLLFPEVNMSMGVASLGVDNSTSCLARAQWSDFEAGCGLCYASSGWQDFPFDIDWSCNDRVWLEFP